MSTIHNLQNLTTVDEALRYMGPTMSYWVKKRANVIRDSCIQYDDLLQEARIGVMRAFEKFDPDRGSFFSYASTWINSRVIRYIEKNLSIVFYPDNKYRRELIPNYNKLMQKFTQETPGLTEGEYKNMIADYLGCDRSHVEAIAHEKRGVVYLNEKFNDADFTLCLSDRESTSPSDQLDGKRIYNFVLTLSEGMTSVEKCILRNRIMGREPYTLAHIAAMHNLSRQRIAQIENRLIEWINNRCKKHFGPPILRKFCAPDYANFA